MTSHDHFEEGLRCLDTKRYKEARSCFLALTQTEASCEEEKSYRYFAEGMVFYEDAAPGSENRVPDEYIRALRRFLAAHEGGMNGFHLLYYLGDVSGKLGIGGRRSPFNKEMKYVCRSFGIQAMLRITNSLGGFEPDREQLERAVTKCQAMYHHHNRFDNLLQTARNFAWTIPDDVLEAKRACTDEEWASFTSVMRQDILKGPHLRLILPADYDSEV